MTEPTAPASEAKAPRRDKLWLPLESNPGLMNKYMKQLGANGEWQFHDIYGTEEDLLMMVPQPVIGVLLLFPITNAQDEYADKERAQIEQKGQVASSKVYFMKQTVGNACGTIGLIHTIANVQDRLQFEDNKFFAKFLAETANKDPMQRAEALEVNQDIEEEHHEIASDPEAKSQVEDINNVNLHFIAFVCVDGHLYELDGRKNFPVNHGPSSPDTLLQDSVKVIQQFMDRDPGEIRFNMVALGPKTEDD